MYYVAFNLNRLLIYQVLLDLFKIIVSLFNLFSFINFNLHCGPSKITFLTTVSDCKPNLT